MRSALVLAWLVVWGPGCVGGVDAPGRVVLLERTPGDDFVVGDDALTFPAEGNEELLLRQPGDVLVCARGEGLLRKVVSVARLGHSIVVATEPATVADAVEDGDVDHQVAAPGAKASGAGGWRGFAFGLGKLHVPGNGFQLDVTGGHFQLDPDLDLHISVKKHELTELRAIVRGTVDAALTADVEVNGKTDRIWYEPLWKKSYPQVQVIGDVPVVETIELTVGIGVELKAQGHAKVHLSGTARGLLGAGAVYTQAGGWTPVDERQVEVTADNHVLEGDLADLRVAAVVYGEVAVKLYGIVGPAIRVVPYAGVERVSGQTGWSPTVGLMGRFEAVASLPFISKREWIPYKHVLFDVSRRYPPVTIETTVAQASCGDVTAQGSCHDGVATSCVAGSLHVEDCAASGLGCVLAGSSVACAPGCGDLDFYGACSGDSLRWCEGGRVSTYTCSASGNGCGWQDDTVGNNCL